MKPGYPDATAFDAKHHHHDPDSDPKNPRWYLVDVKLVRRLPRVITLDELRAHAKKELSGMVLLRPGNRLSVMPVDCGALEVHHFDGLTDHKLSDASRAPTPSCL